MRTLEHPTPTPDDLNITAISRSAWRVADRRLDGVAGIALLGFVELVNGRYEVTRYDSLHSSTHEVLSSALAEFLRCPGGHQYLGTDDVPKFFPAGAYSPIG